MRFPPLQSPLLVLPAILCLAMGAVAQGAWYDNAWTFRRQVKVIWDDQRGSGDELAEANIFTAGHARPDGKDLRVAGEDGKLVASELLSVGPGDTARVVFALDRGQRTYFIYFGNADPKPAPKNLDHVDFKAGLLMELREYTGAPFDNALQAREAFDKAGPVLGRIMIDRPMIGHNPFGDQDRTVCKLTGSIFAPIDGKYIFAQATDDRGALYIDDKPLVFSELGPGDTRYHGAIDLKRGRHAFEMIQVNFSGPGYLTVGWKRPDMPKFEGIARESFGIVSHAIPGAMEEFRKTLTADFDVQYKGEFFFLDRYTQRYHFVAYPAKAPATCEWDFGDGQTATGPEVDHVYLVDGIHPIKLTARIGGNADTQTTKMMVRRDFENITNPATDGAEVQSQLVAAYDVNKMPLNWLPTAVHLHLRAGNLDAAARVIDRLVAERRHADANEAFTALDACTEARLDKNQEDAALAPWAKIPADSDLQPRAVKAYADYLLWRRGDPHAATEALAPFRDAKDDKLQRIRGQALVLDQRFKEGAEILRALKPQGEADRQGAISGALARTIEYYITEKDPETGEQQWDRWQAAYPTDFIEGYSLFLRVQLMALRRDERAAATIAEAFANAVPDSPYAPRLLDLASKWLEKSAPDKSKSLRQTLKQRYPEDQLAQ